jgi:hypothetical protein
MILSNFIIITPKIDQGTNRSEEEHHDSTRENRRKQP